MKITQQLLVLCVALLLSACIGPTINMVRLNGDDFSPVSPLSVAVMTASGVQRPYKEIGIFDVEEGPGTQTYEEMITALKAKAGAIGANAVLIDASQRTQGFMPVGGLLMAVNGKHIKAVAIRWSDK